MQSVLLNAVFAVDAANVVNPMTATLVTVSVHTVVPAICIFCLVQQVKLGLKFRVEISTVDNL